MLRRAHFPRAAKCCAHVSLGIERGLARSGRPRRMGSLCVKMKRDVFLLGSSALMMACALRANAGPATFVTLSSADEPFRAEFNRHRAAVRVVELVSPTCPFCLEGVSKIQQSLFASDNNPGLVGFVIWVPMLGGKASNVPEAAALAPDRRVLHYWDASNDLGASYEHILPVSTGPAWDVYMLFAPGVVWSGAEPPRPSFWMHQLAISNAPRLDATIFANQARQMLAKVGSR
jgi:hypothetical protein